MELRSSSEEREVVLARESLASVVSGFPGTRRQWKQARRDEAARPDDTVEAPVQAKGRVCCA